MTSTEPRVLLGNAGITTKSIVTVNDFVSHMIEHIAWRLGCSVDVVWIDEDWHALGLAIGQQVALLPRYHDAASALGMIDDGSAEVVVQVADRGMASLTAVERVDVDWFLGLRCEQLSNGQPLVDMLNGLALGAGVDIQVTLASVEDPHHSWEGIYRGVGIALARLGAQPIVLSAHEPDRQADPELVLSQRAVERGWMTEQLGTRSAQLHRETAESDVTVRVSLGGGNAICEFSVADSIEVVGMTDLLREFASGAGIDLKVSFLATRLSSSHVVAEDTALALGRALRGIAVERMEHIGIQGAGSNISTLADMQDRPIRVGVSMEGRKFWKYVPFQQSYHDFRRSFLIGHTLPNGIFSEDLDDFIDGFAGGLQASVMVHIARPIDPIQGWPLLFQALGQATAELLSPNPARRQLIAGVKATLA